MEHSEAQRKITAILHSRKEQLAKVEKEIEQWKKLDRQISALEEAIETLKTHPDTSESLKRNFSGFHIEQIDSNIAETLKNLNQIKARFSRNTLNIGVSGRARVGKSTLLQAISGLGDEQIPTGSGLPVTAVRSRIFHSEQQRRATLILHTYASFRQDVLQPYHTELGLPQAPQRLEDFSQYAYPPSERELPESKRQESSAITILRRLREMQLALPSYEQDLTGGEKTVSLDELRQYVAYPTATQIEAGENDRRYLAVRDVRIECQFPYAQVEQLGIIDLPGLGELAANAEEYHLSGLQNEVDLVLMVKRPVEGMAYWGKEDGAAADLLDRARGFIKNRRDFVSLVLNTGGAAESLITALRGDVLRNVNDGEPNRHYQVYETNALEQQAVYEQVLHPVLRHLAERLPVMDAEILEGTRSRYRATQEQIQQFLDDVENALRTGRTHAPTASAAEDLYKRTGEMHKNIASELHDFLLELKKQARAKEEDNRYVEAVESAYQSAKSWIDAGFGKGKEAWCQDALKIMKADKGSGGFGIHESNRIRVEISHKFAEIDGYFQQSTDGLWARILDILRPHLGRLLAEQEGKAALEQLEKLLHEAPEPCTVLASATQDLLDLRLDYRTQLHPRVRQSLDALEWEYDDPENPQVQKVRYACRPDEEGAGQLFLEMTALARQAIYSAKKALIGEALAPALVIHATVEQFDDAFIRSGESLTHFHRLARSYRDDIWPGIFAGLEAANTRIANVQSAAKAIREILSQ